MDFMNFFPNNKINNTNYLPPIIAIRFNLRKYETIEFDVECSLWSKEPLVNQIKKVRFKIKKSNYC